MPRHLFLLVPAVALAALAGIAPGQIHTAAAQDQGGIQQRLSTIEQDLKDGRAAVISLEHQTVDLAADINALRVQIGAASRAAQRYAVDIASLDAELTDLSAREAASLRDLASRRKALSITLAGLQRLSLRPQAALLVTPGDLNDVVRSGLLLRSAVPGIERQAAELRQQLTALADLRQQIAGRRNDLSRTRQSLTLQQQQLTALRTEKSGVLDRARVQRDDTVARLDSLAGEADNLEELLAQLQRESAQRAREAAERAAAAERLAAAERQAAAERLAAAERQAAAERLAALERESATERLARTAPSPRHADFVDIPESD